MTATFYSALPARRAHDVAPKPINYVARRCVAALLAVLSVVLLVAAASVMSGVLADVAADLGSRPAVAADAAVDAAIVRIHVAQPGDTLWSIADTYRGDIGQARFVEALIDRNGGTAIQVGQAVKLP